MSWIDQVQAREILDFAWQSNVEAEVTLVGGEWAEQRLPRERQHGEHEAVELRDGDKKRYGGKGVLKAVRNINEVIAPS